MCLRKLSAGDTELKPVAEALPAAASTATNASCCVSVGGRHGSHAGPEGARHSRSPGGRVAAPIANSARYERAAVRRRQIRYRYEREQRKRGGEAALELPLAEITATSSGSSALSASACATRRRAAVGVQARDLAERVDAGVGSPGDGESVPAREDGVECRAKHRLHRPVAGLRLAQLEARAAPVVFEHELQGDRHELRRLTALDDWPFTRQRKF